MCAIMELLEKLFIGQGSNDTFYFHEQRSMEPSWVGDKEVIPPQEPVPLVYSHPSLLGCSSVCIKATRQGGGQKLSRTWSPSHTLWKILGQANNNRVRITLHNLHLSEGAWKQWLT